MSTYVLIHGSWHGAWCWDKVVPLLKKAGHVVKAPDLPGHGQDHTPIAEVSLQAYADRVCAILDEQPEPVVLVGHSMGGTIVTQAAEHRPERIKNSVYLAAYLLPDGQTLLQAALADADSLVPPSLIFADDQSYTTVRDEAVKEVFYGDCSNEDVARARSLLCPQALAPTATPVSTTEENFGRVPRVYIECLDDRALSPAAQKEMYSALPCRKVIAMNTSHSPFFSAPEELAAHLKSLERAEPD